MFAIPCLISVNAMGVVLFYQLLVLLSPEVKQSKEITFNLTLIHSLARMNVHFNLNIFIFTVIYTAKKESERLNERRVWIVNSINFNWFRGRG